MFKMIMNGYLGGMTKASCYFIALTFSVHRCKHNELMGPPADPHGNNLEYFCRTEKVFRALQKLLMDDQWLQYMRYYVKFRLVDR